MTFPPAQVQPSIAALPVQEQSPITLAARVVYGDVVALDVDLKVPGSGVTAIFGPSGCGKTTLLRAVAGLTRPSPGHIVVAGETWQDDAARIWRPTHKRPVGVVFQESSLFDHLTVQGNLDFGLKRVPPAQRRVSLEHAVELLGIGHLRDRRPAQLSGGERQRVAIARALATSPQLMLMDEPLASLDAARKAELLPYFEQLVRELRVPMFYVTHSIEEVARLADHLVLLRNGKMVAQGVAGPTLGRIDVARTQGEGASAVVEGMVESVDDAYQLISIRFSGGLLTCVHGENTPARHIGQGVRMRVQARDVSITLAPAADTSILNVVPVVVQSIHGDGPAQMLVMLDAQGTSLLARITRKSADTLGIAPGMAVYAQVKSVALLD